MSAPSDLAARYGSLVGDARLQELGIDRETFARALSRSIEKSGIQTNPDKYVRSLKHDDLALAAACAAGSEKAWRILQETMRSPLRAAGRAMCGDRGEELADGLFGELYVARERKLTAFGGRSTLIGWLRAVLYQTWIDRLRSEKRLTQIDEEAPEPAAPPVPDAVEMNQNSAIASDVLEAAMRALPPRQKLLLDFYYTRNLTLREAAKLVGVHEATASRELDRARAALKAQMTDILRRERQMDARAAESLMLNWQPAASSRAAAFDATGASSRAAAFDATGASSRAAAFDAPAQENAVSRVLSKE